jgi:hypothetical protein
MSCGLGVVGRTFLVGGWVRLCVEEMGGNVVRGIYVFRWRRDRGRVVFVERVM